MTDSESRSQLHWLLRFSTPGEIYRRVVFAIAILATVGLGTLSVIDAFDWVGKPFAGFLMNRRLTVSTVGMPDWPANQSGMFPADLIVGIEGQDVKQVEDLERVIAAAEVGSILNYTVKRGEENLSFSLPVTRFTSKDLLGTFGATFLRGFIYFSIGIIVFILKPDSTVGLLFSLAATLQAATNFVDFAVISSASPFSYMVIICENFISAIVLHFSLIFPYRYKFLNKKRKIVYLPYILAALISLILLSLYPGPLFYKAYLPLVYSYIYIAIFSFLGSCLFSYFRSASMLSKQRARVIFWGALFAFPLPLLAAILANTGELISSYPIFTNLTAMTDIIFPAVIAYSITQHNLFDIDIYIKRAVGYGLMTALLGFSYFGIQLLMKGILLHETAEKLTPAIFAILVVVFFNPINRRIQSTIDRIFFRQKFDYKKTVIAMSEALSSVLDIKEIVTQISNALRQEMFIDNAGVMVLSQDQEAFNCYFVEDSGKDQIKEKEFSVSQKDKVVSLLADKRKILTRYDIAEDPSYNGQKTSYLEAFDKLGATMFIPMVYQDKLNAVISVGNKKSGQFYNKNDVELLKTLASHGAVSIENAKLAEQMKHEESVRTNLARYLSPQVVDGIVNSDMQVNLGGDRKVVTVLFSDIRDFTRITENQPADKLVKMLNEYFTSMAEGIFAHQGSLDKYIGDAIVAVFGSLVPLDNPENSAALAAVDMMRRLEKLNKIWTSRGDFTMQMGIGICTGEVFLGNIGSLERMEFTVIGDTVNMASRLSGKAVAGQIIVSESVKSHLSPSIATKEMPPIQVKGKTGQHKVYEILY